jgi:DNA modification methylase
VTVRIINADVMDGLAQLGDGSVHCVVTSPPYFGLRDYGTARWDGGSTDCDHLMPPNGIRDKGRDRKASNGKFHDSPKPNQIRQQFARECCKCGASRIDKQIGLELTPDAYVSTLVEVFRGVKRVLRKDGTCWLNLGDSYAGSWGAQSRPNGNDSKSNLGGGSMLSARQIEAHPKSTQTGSLKNTPGCKPKDLIGIPWRVAFALQADGWWLRQDIIWSKPNPMPESVTDRCTKAHEYLFLLTKAERYFYDADAIAELSLATGPSWAERKAAGEPTRHGLASAAACGAGGFGATDGKRNKRSVWEVTTQPFPEAHFATFPPALIEPCIKAGCPEGGTVLDPFGGSGTTGLVSDRLKRNAILIELNPEYAAMAEKRIKGDCPMFANVSA